MHPALRFTLCAAALAIGGSPARAAPASELLGPWTLMRFLGGPPAPGQITDTLAFNGESRRVKITRNRAGVAGPDHACEADAPDEVWGALLAALTNADLQTALAHPDRVPRLLIDAGYFKCTHRGAQAAVSDMVSAADQAKPEVRALRELAEVAQRLNAELVALPPCASL